jgi:hypothetical protein
MIDPSYSDLIADIAVNESAQAPRTQTAGASAGGGQNSRTDTAQARIPSRRSASSSTRTQTKHMKIFEANRNQLSNPNDIKTGQQLVIRE